MSNNYKRISLYVMDGLKLAASCGLELGLGKIRYADCQVETKDNAQ